MSSHYIYLECSTPDCDTTEMLYTGDIYSDLFDDSGPESWEGETIKVRCKECKSNDSAPEPPIFAGTTAALEALTIRAEAVSS